MRLPRTQLVLRTLLILIISNLFIELDIISLALRCERDFCLADSDNLREFDEIKRCAWLHELTVNYHELIMNFFFIHYKFMKNYFPVVSGSATNLDELVGRYGGLKAQQANSPEHRSGYSKGGGSP